MPNSIREHDLSPLLRVRYYYMEKWGSDDAYKAALEDERQLLLRLQSTGKRMIYLFEFGPDFHLNPVQRQIQSDWLRAVAQLEREVMPGKAFVTSSFVFRGIITAVNWLSPPAVPYTVERSAREALVWIFDLSERNGVALTVIQRNECSMSFGLGVG